ncbi:MAG: MFS transporter [Victivallales bacterium]|nr:MFS transporter [Victivallales bacterium]
MLFKSNVFPMKAGTLSYTKLRLFVTIAWMFFGIFAFCLMEFLPVLFPLPLKQYGSSNAYIGLLLGSIPAMLNFIVNPIVSSASDRTRTRFGRRMPFLMFATPIVTVLLILIGWSPELGTLLSKYLPAKIQIATVIIVLLSILITGFQVFNLFIASIFYYVAPDILPHEVLGRFMSFWSVIAAGTGFLFNRYVLPLGRVHMNWVFTVLALFYFVAFMLVCFNVKEGQYPPPEKRKRKLYESFCAFFRECYSLRFYQFFFMVAAMNSVSVCCRNLFQIFFAEEDLGMDLGTYGRISSYGGIVTLILAFPIGLLVDRFHPIRIYMVGMITVIFVNLFGFFMVQDTTSFFIFGLLLAVVYSLQTISTLPLYAAVYPAKKYGQFSSAGAMANSVMLLIFSYLAGLFIDFIGDYRYIYIWDFVFTSIAMVGMVFVYRQWKKQGGAKDFRAPVFE